MKVRDVMTAPAITVSAATCAARAAQQLVRHGVSGLPVVDENGYLVGLVTEADLIAIEVTGASLNVISVGDVMTTGVAVADLNDDVESMSNRMVALGHRRLPVIDGSRVVGVVSRRDLLRHCDAADREILISVRKAIDDAGLTGVVTATVSAGVVRLTGEVRDSDRRGLDERIALIDGALGVDDRLSTPY